MDIDSSLRFREKMVIYRGPVVGTDCAAPRPFDGRRSGDQDGAVSASATCTVYYDGGCPLCRSEIARYRRLRGAEAIAWVDATRCDEAALGPGLDRRAALDRLHFREADGSLTSGAAAFVSIWRRLTALAPLAKLVSFPPLTVLLEAVYALVLRVRPLWRTAPDTRRP
jgi:predicted DCC family thiol-disulfide oxidoreductase YuxK